MSSLEELYTQVCNEVSEIFRHCPLICELATKCQHVTELGGNLPSTVAILAGRPTKFFSFKANKDAAEAVAEKVKDAVTRTNFYLKYGNPLKIQIEETDMLVIDTKHTSSQLKQELIRHAGNVKRYIVIPHTHTYGTRGEDGSHPGITQAIVDFIEENPQWEIIHTVTLNNGIMVLEREPPTGADFDRMYTLVTFDIPEVKWVERIIVGNPGLDYDLTEEEREQQMAKLNRALRYGIIVGIERNFDTIIIDDKEVLTGFLVYHVGFRNRPIGK